ncbi:MAG: hypothetical protein ABJE95_32920 [Byssovorax sp.]
MRRLSFRSSGLSLAALLAAAVSSVAGCAALSLGSSGSGESSATGAGGGLILPGATGAGGSTMVSGTSGAGGSFTPPYLMGSYTYLCGGDTASCIPGNAVCSLIDPGKNDGGIGGNTTTTTSGSGGGSASSSSSGAGGAPPDKSTSSATGGESDAGVLPPTLTCKLAPISGAAVAGCVPAGDLVVGNPCQTAGDCGVGLACVATPSGGVCRPYCCGEVEECPLDTYCAPVPMAEAAVKIPVCLPAYKCKPLDDSTCMNGQTCTIVRDDGTTSCVDPGDGSRGDHCPCGAGQVCSKITNTCLKLCHIGSDTADCGAGTCQGGVMGYPDGIGICVGYP